MTLTVNDAVEVIRMGALTDRRFTATQYALLSSLMGVPRVLASAPTGWLAQEMGWAGFFLLCVAIALPGLFMVKRVWRLMPAEAALASAPAR